MAADDFCLRWNDHHDLFFNAAEQLCRGDFLTDVTLSCGDRYFSAHKLVLSVCSNYFAKLFASRRAPPFTQTIVYLKDVDPKHLELILSYMYRGEINVQEGELMDLLNTAKGLQVKGLTETDEEELPPLRPPPRAADGKRKALVVHSQKETEAKRIKVEERWSGAQQDSVPATAGAAVIARADPDYQGPEGYDQDYYATPTADEDEFEEQDIGPGSPVAMPVEASLAEEEDSEDGVEDVDGGSNVDRIEKELFDDEHSQHKFSPDNSKDQYSPPPPLPMHHNPAAAPKELQQHQPTYNCPFCAKPFHARWMLERHLPSHTGQRPFKCIRCDRRFSLQSSAVRHVKNVHRNEDFDVENEASSMVVKDKGGILGGGSVSIGPASVEPDGRGDHGGVIDAGDNQLVIG